MIPFPASMGSGERRLLRFRFERHFAPKEEKPLIQVPESTEELQKRCGERISNAKYHLQRFVAGPLQGVRTNFQPVQDTLCTVVPFDMMPAVRPLGEDAGEPDETVTALQAETNRRILEQLETSAPPTAQTSPRSASAPLSDGQIMAMSDRQLSEALHETTRQTYALVDECERLKESLAQQGLVSNLANPRAEEETAELQKKIQGKEAAIAVLREQRQKLNDRLTGNASSEQV